MELFSIFFMKRIERFDKYLSYKGLNDNIVTNDLGLSVGTIGKSRKDGRDLSDRVVELILNFYTDLSRVWLLTGEGEMLIADTTPRIEEASIVRADEEVEVDIVGIAESQNITLHDIATIIGESVTYIEDCKGKLYPRHIMKLQDRFGDAVVDRYAKYTKTVEVEVVESFPIVPEFVIAEPNANIEKVIEEDGSELETISPNLLLSNMKVNMVEQIKGTSMLPTFQPDDWVFIRFLKNKMKIVSGKTYYLNCKNRPTMIRMVKFEGEDKLRLIAKNSQYDDVVIDRSDIINIGNVAALFRMSFGDQYSEIEALRRHKDQQLDERNQQINSFIDIQREMIAEIRESGKRNDRLIEKIINQ